MTSVLAQDAGRSSWRVEPLSGPSPLVLSASQKACWLSDGMGITGLANEYQVGAALNCPALPA